MEELVKYTIVMRQGFDLFGDRYSEREDRRKKKAKKDDEERVRKEQELRVEAGEKENVKDRDDVNGIKSGNL